MTLAVEMVDLTVRFNAFTAVDRLNLKVETGEVFGFLGANGAGKTTTIRVLTGLLEPTSGSVRVAGLTFAEEGGRAIRRKVGYMSQKFTLYNDLTVRENLAFTAGLHKMPAARLALRSREILDFIGFGHTLGELVRDLPGGVKQEVSLAAALLHDPEIVFLDEPTAGVSPGARARFWGLIRRLASQGKTIFLTTHYMDEAEECGRIALLRGGKLIALGAPAELERQAFPEPMVEVRWAGETPADWQNGLPPGAVGMVSPHGASYHVVLKDPALWRAFVARQGPPMLCRDIRPSLEDVFLRLVEEGGA